MNIGLMNRKITIERPTYAISDDNNDKYISAWRTYKILWASWLHQSSQEVFDTGQMIAKDTYDWRCRYLDASGVTQDMRISYNSEYYYIIGIKELGHRDALQITTIKRDNGT